MKPSRWTWSGYSLEMERLCACLDPCGSQTVSREEACRWQSLDWPRFLELATHHHVIPAVVRTVKSVSAHPGLVPAHWLEHLQFRGRAIAAFNLRAAHVLHRLQQALDAGGVPSAPVKGPALALLACRDLALRQFEDLDVLVRQSDLLRAVELLAKEGYRPRELSSRTPPAGYLKTLQGWSLCRDGYPPVDLKPVVASHVLSRPADVGFMLEACRPLDLGNGRRLKVPGPEAMLLAVCMDGANEKWFKLSSVADVAALLARHPEGDWAGLLRDAGRMGQRRSLLAGVQVAALLLNIPLPPPFQDAMNRDPFAGRLAFCAASWIASEPSRHQSILQQSWFGFQTRERLEDRLRFMRRLLFVPGPYEFEKWPLPGLLHPFHALVRPMRLVWDVLGRRGRHRRLNQSVNTRLPFSSAGRAE